MVFIITSLIRKNEMEAAIQAASNCKYKEILTTGIVVKPHLEKDEFIDSRITYIKNNVDTIMASGYDSKSYLRVIK